MPINGFNKTTLLDYPGKIASTIFLGGCNFRCPFCQNSSLVLSPNKQPVISTEEVLSVLKKRQGILEGVCITGGEPTLDKDLFLLIDKIKELGYPVKLDTNGSHPWILKKLVNNQMIDMVAMDIKSSKESYAKVSGCKNIDLTSICESVEFLLSNVIPYEFRTTVSYRRCSCDSCTCYLSGTVFRRQKGWCIWYRLRSYGSKTGVKLRCILPGKF